MLIDIISFSYFTANFEISLKIKYFCNEGQSLCLLLSMIFFTAFLFRHLDKAMLMKLFPEILELLSIVQKTAKFVKETL